MSEVCLCSLNKCNCGATVHRCISVHFCICSSSSDSQAVSHQQSWSQPPSSSLLSHECLARAGTLFLVALQTFLLLWTNVQAVGKQCKVMALNCNKVTLRGMKNRLKVLCILQIVLRFYYTWLKVWSISTLRHTVTIDHLKKTFKIISVRAGRGVKHCKGVTLDP